MKFTFACKKVALNDSIKEYAEKKISKLDRYFPEEADAFVTFAVEKKNRCVVELTIRAANGTLFRAQEEDPDGDMRGAIDEAVAFINQFPGITHNYERSHDYSIWFTLIAINRPTRDWILDRIEACDAVQRMMRFEMSQRFKIDVTFDVAAQEGGRHASTAQ